MFDVSDIRTELMYHAVMKAKSLIKVFKHGIIRKRKKNTDVTVSKL